MSAQPLPSASYGVHSEVGKLRKALVVDRLQLETLVVAAATGAILAPNGAGDDETTQDQPPA